MASNRDGGTSPAEGPGQQMPVGEALAAGVSEHQAGRLQSAEALYRQILQVDPQNAEALHLLGLIAHQVGQHEAAVDLIGRAVGLNGRVAHYHNNLGAALLALGRLDQALASLQVALSLDPNYPEAHCNAGNVFRAQGHPESAAACYTRALAINPRLPDAHNNLGVILQAEGRLQEAVSCYRQALALSPAYADAYHNLSCALLEDGRDEEALPFIHKAIELNPAYGDAYYNLANTYKAAGRFDEAIACFRQILALNPRHCAAYRGLSVCKTFTEVDLPLVSQMEALAQQADVQADTASDLHFALGKVYDDLQRFDEAFAHYRQGNALERRKYVYEPASHEDNISRIMDTFSGDFFAQRRSWGTASELPVFIVGMMRSGTTLVEQIISSHPAVHGAGELDFWGKRAAPLLEDYARLAVEEVSTWAGDYLRTLQAMAPEAIRVTDKMPHNFLHLGLIHLALPHARIIHCRRDPIDTCLSIYFRKFGEAHPYAYNLEDLASFYEQYQRLMAHWRSVLPPECLLEVDYEDLVSDQEKISRHLIDFCGLEWDTACLAFHRNERKIKTASNWQVRQPIYGTSVGRWKRYEKFIGPLAAFVRENAHSNSQ
jgi:tetratricopeptide (TPR) repeat protein